MLYFRVMNERSLYNSMRLIETVKFVCTTSNPDIFRRGEEDSERVSIHFSCGEAICLQYSTSDSDATHDQSSSMMKSLYAVLDITVTDIIVLEMATGVRSTLSLDGERKSHSELRHNAGVFPIRDI